jgi:hypothetical protein
MLTGLNSFKGIKQFPLVIAGKLAGITSLVVSKRI